MSMAADRTSVSEAVVRVTPCTRRLTATSFMVQPISRQLTGVPLLTV